MQHRRDFSRTWARVRALENEPRAEKPHHGPITDDCLVECFWLSVQKSGHLFWIRISRHPTSFDRPHDRYAVCHGSI